MHHSKIWKFLFDIDLSSQHSSLPLKMLKELWAFKQQSMIQEDSSDDHTTFIGDLRHDNKRKKDFKRGHDGKRRQAKIWIPELKSSFDFHYLYFPLCRLGSVIPPVFNTISTRFIVIRLLFSPHSALIFFDYIRIAYVYYGSLSNWHQSVTILRMRRVDAT